MSSDAVDWLVDVQGTSVVVTFGHGDDRERRMLTRHQVRVLREQLRLAYLLAGRNKLTEDAEAVDVDTESGLSGAVVGDEESDRAKLAAIERTAGILSGTFPSSRGASAPESDAHSAAERQTADGLPEGWRIWPEGANVHFEVPASEADGEFELSRSEAAAVGIVLQWLAVPPSLREDLTDSETVRKRRSGPFRAISSETWGELFNGPGVEISDEEWGGAE